MDYFGAGRRQSGHSFYAKLFNGSPNSGELGSEHSLTPINPAAKRNHTVSSFTSAHDQNFEYTKLEFANELPSSKSIPSFQETPEKPKQAIRKGFWANSSTLLPHLATSIVTAAVVGLNFRNVYWMDLLAPNVQILPGITQDGALNALQLAAKLHELLLVASLGTIVLHVAHAHLTGNHGLPLGLLTNAFSIGSGDFLRRKAFWTSAWTSNAHYWRFWLLSLLATILATLSGPSSAIAIIPSLDWFPVHRPFKNQVLPYYVFNESTALWPETVTASSVNSADSGVDCLEAALTTTVEEICPAGDFRDLYSWAGNLLFVNSSTGSNASIPDARGDTRRVLSTRSCPSGFDGRASGMSLNTFITSALTQWWQFAQDNYDGLGLEVARPRLTLKNQIYAPRVEVICNGFQYFNTTELEDRKPVKFPSLTPNSTFSNNEFQLPYNGTYNATDVQWVKMPEGSESPTLGAAVRIPWIYLTNASTTETRQATEIQACSIYAQWIPVYVWYEPRTTDQVSYFTQGQLPSTCLDIPRAPSVDSPIRNMTIDQQYADAINQPIPFTQGNVPAIQAMLNQLVFEQGVVAPTNQTGYAFKSPLVVNANGSNYIQTTDDEVRKSRATVISTMLAGVITDGLARIAGNGIYPYSAAMFLTNKTDSSGGLVGRFVVSSAKGGQDESLNATSADLNDWLRIDPEFSRYGYGYRYQGSGTAQFGIVILLIHVALAAMHTAFILYKVLVAREGLVGSWTTVAELLTLALNSSPSSRLQNTCAGVSAAKTWREEISVREISNGHLGLVVGPEEKSRYKLPQAGLTYGHLID
ncbi:uncharacterized protein PV06_10843 [Exophiala oligosperma]|uniref:Uncharacterized protein n=2 Tax=Chaetothyriales TaxID=34395 RepID=A0A0D2BHP8_9EURO|nr:uncharacterized protein PV06_10843 [Exophiala oligosperma]KAJ9639756.1 hypothetical protein H2204_003549 [Knufia peltigerae]KIW36942.1 hypothetical protein PV06_10843 [Exophiala oligosperma]